MLEGPVNDGFESEKNVATFPIFMRPSSDQGPHEVQFCMYFSLNSIFTCTPYRHAHMIPDPPLTRDPRKFSSICIYMFT